MDSVERAGFLARWRVAQRLLPEPGIPDEWLAMAGFVDVPIRPYLIHPAPATDGLDEVVEDGDVFEGEQLEQQVAGDNEDDEEWVPWLQGRP